MSGPGLGYSNSIACSRGRAVKVSVSEVMNSALASNTFGASSAFGASKNERVIVTTQNPVQVDNFYSLGFESV